MKRLSHLGVAVVTVALLSPSSPQRAFAIPSYIFSAHLSGSEVVPAAETRAAGQAKFTLTADGTLITFRVNVANIENAVQANLRLGMPGQNGETVVVLYGPVAAGGGKKSGLLAAGTITQANLVGSLSGRPLADLVSAMKSGGVYVDVATSNGQGTTERQPGNHPDGEIRGQIK